MKSIQFLAIFALVFSFGMTAQARDADESMLMLREAMMDSNADYNKHKKKTNYEEFDRADEWAVRDSQAIQVGDSYVDPADMVDFKQPQESKSDRDVSSTESFQDDEI